MQGRNHASLVRHLAIGCAVAMACAAPSGMLAQAGGGTPIGREDFAPDSGTPRMGPIAAAADSGTEQPYRAPLSGTVARDGDVLYALVDSDDAGVFRHPAGLYVIRFPSDWRMIASTTGGSVSRTFSAEAGRVAPRRIKSGVRVESVFMSDQFRPQRMAPAALLAHLLPAILRGEPGMKLEGGVAAARMGGLPAATCTLRGARKDLPGEHVLEIVIGEKEGMAFQLTGFAAVDEFQAFRQAFLRIAAESSFGRPGNARRDVSLEARRIVQQYKGSVVSIFSSTAQGTSTGSGFIVSRDGHVLTNYHVAFDTRTHAPRENIVVEWDESLRRPKVPAKIVDGKFRMSAFRFQHGVDVALLKIPAGDYEPLPLSPLAEVEAGDGIVALGFPSRGMLEGISLTVTTGVVTRFNRGPSGDVASIYVDAAFTHGSSGGPSVSLVTGGVIGLNSFGMDVQLDPRYAQLNDLIKYHGVVPIDAALREFPLHCSPGLAPQGSGLDFLACLDLEKHFRSLGSLRAAEQLARRAVSLEPTQAIARARLGDCLFQAALEKDGEGRAEESRTLLDGAGKAYDEALKRDVLLPAALVSKARLEFRLNRLEEAAALAARAAEAEPDGWEGSMLLADIRLRQSQYDEALRQVERVKARVGGVIVQPHMTAASIHVARKEYEKAGVEWKEAARISPVYLPARLGVGAWHEFAGRTDAALDEYARVLNDFPENGEVLGRIGLCLNHAGRRPEAVGYFTRSVERCRAAGLLPDESVLMFLGDELAVQPEPAGALPVYALYLFHHRNGRWAAPASLKMAALHAKFGAAGLASAHARFAVQLRNDPDISKAARAHAQAPLSLPEIRAMVGVLRYPEALAAELVAQSPLGFALDGSELEQMQREGVPGAVLKAILDSLSRNPPRESAVAIPAQATPGAAIVPSQPAPDQRPVRVAPQPEEAVPSGFIPPAGRAPDGQVGDLRGTWVATGMTPNHGPFRSVIIFGDFDLYSSSTWVGMQTVGAMRGRYRLENGRLVLEPEGGQPFTPRFRMEGDTMIMDVAGFAPEVRFDRDRSPGAFAP